MSLRDRLGARLPWAFLGACVVLLTLEAALHATKWPDPIPYELGRDEYYAAAAELNRVGPAEVSVVGSSRSREGLSMPLMSAALHQALGQKLSVANYSVGGARAIDFEAVTQRILRAKSLPRAIVIGVAERDLAASSYPDGVVPIIWQYDNAPIFWNLHDWRTSFNLRGAPAFESLPQVLRNTVGPWFQLLGRRDQIRLRLFDMLRGVKLHGRTSPIRGEPTPWHVSAPHKRLDRKDKGMDAKVMLYVNRDLLAFPYPDPEQVAAFERLAEACQLHKVRLILYEMPISDPLMRNMPAGMNDTYRTTIQRISSKYGAMFVRLKTLDFHGSFRDFREPSHMNLDGAQRLTTALVEKALAPTLKRDQARTNEEKRSDRQSTGAPNAGKKIRAPATQPATTSATR